MGAYLFAGQFISANNDNGTEHIRWLWHNSLINIHPLPACRGTHHPQFPCVIHYIILSVRSVNFSLLLPSTMNKVGDRRVPGSEPFNLPGCRIQQPGGLCVDVPKDRFTWFPYSLTPIVCLCTGHIRTTGEGRWWIRREVDQERGTKRTGNNSIELKGKSFVIFYGNFQSASFSSLAGEHCKH